ncbi:MAG: arginine--tRNA ligase [Candidatus Doudnabacteria bacterium]
MLMREKIAQQVLAAVGSLGIKPTDEQKAKITVTYPDFKLGDYSSNAALILSREAKLKPLDLANKIVGKLDKGMFEKADAVAPGFINFKLILPELQSTTYNLQPKTEGKILLEYFQPNIAKPLHIGHLETAIIGDTIKRQLLYMGKTVESDTHMGDWGTQFGYLILAYKKFGEVNDKLYAQLNADDSQKEAAKHEFVKLEQGDVENRKIWQQLVEASMKEFLKINDLMDILRFEHHWPESFYEDKMPVVLEDLKQKKLLVESQGAQIVDLEQEKLGVAIIVKSDGGTTYLLRDLATFLFVKKEGFTKHLYVVDNRQSLHYKQLFSILKSMGKFEENEGIHIDYGFISFKGQALSTRKGNMVLAQDVIAQAEEKVSKIIAEKNPDLKNKQEVIKAVTKGALKYFILKHNRHSDIEFDWNEVLDFEGDSGPYLQYAYARMASILRKAGNLESGIWNLESITPTERQILFQSSILSEIVSDATKDYLPNILANYLYGFAKLLNKFYHESPVTQEKDEKVRNFRLALVSNAKATLGKGLDLLGIKALEEM